MNYLALIGGGFFLIYLLYAAWEIMLFKRVMDDPVKGKMASVAAGYLTACLFSIGLAGAGAEAFLYYLVPTVIIGTFAYRRGMTLREQPEPDKSLEGVFD